MQGRAVYLADGRRTPIGRHGGALSRARADVGVGKGSTLAPARA